jgi:phosphate starvation-inducible PhoH-like protein
MLQRPSPTLHEVTIPLRSTDEAILVLGPYDRYAKLLRQALEIEIFARNGNLRLRGEDGQVLEARRRIDHLLGKSRKGRELGVEQIEAILLGEPREGAAPERRAHETAGPVRPSTYSEMVPSYRPSRAVGPMRARPVEPRTESQRRYLELIEKLDLVFGVGIAGTGKTYLAVAAAVQALRKGVCRRLVITRPVVEAGERLGFLPGDMQAKLNPYTRPIYDALHDMLDHEDVVRLEETGVIEVAPLAYMRGRTLANAFVVLDEGQNATVNQMMMFLTRLGEHSKMVVTGDPTQTDLDDGRRSGLIDAVQRLRPFQEVGIVEFTAKDVVRHPLVEKIVRAYEGGPRREPRPGRAEP